jgi:hypothetical protein
MPDHARRVLFALNEPGYFRFYGPAIVELERRGWNVSLVYGKPEKRGPDLKVPASAGDRVRSLGTLPSDVSSIAKNLRIAIDCARYLESAFEKAEYLRRRAERELSPGFAFIKHVKRAPRAVVSTAIGVARVVERLLPVSQAMRDFLSELQPDLVVVSPLVIIGGSGVQETEVIKAAQALGIPTVVAVASWDHLTSKGLIRLVPDAVVVWNDVQAKEAAQLHRIPWNRIIVTGAQSFDRWFDRPPPDAIDAFRRRLGIDATRHILLLVGSSRNMAPGDSEVQFARRWITAIRRSNDARVRDAFVIVRPHPGNTEPWRAADLGDPHAVVYPTSYASGILLSHADVETFWYSLVASSAVVGINTSAMIEAAVVRRPVFSVRDPVFAHSQQQTLHFAYLSADAGGFTVVADDLPQHVRQLERLFAAGEPDLRQSDAFVARFVRPLGLATDANTHLCDALERVAATHRASCEPADAVTVDTPDAISPGR